LQQLLEFAIPDQFRSRRTDLAARNEEQVFVTGFLDDRKLIDLSQ